MSYRIFRTGEGAADMPIECYSLDEVKEKAKWIGLGTFAVVELFRRFGRVAESAQWGEATVHADGTVTLNRFAEVS